VKLRDVRSVAALVVVVLALGIALGAVRSGGRISTDDRNGDGRPDVWRTFDAAGHLVEVAVDSNFDGRSDVREIYADGNLVRRESDRNYDDRVDLIEDFDEITHEHVRSEVDADFDGSADLLVLFRDDRPVYSEWAVDRPASAPIPVSASARDLGDPFAGDYAMHSIATADAPSVVAVVTATVALDAAAVATDIVGAKTFDSSAPSRPRSPAARVSSPRGPPLA
jgi:hypothetical protein